MCFFLTAVKQTFILLCTAELILAKRWWPRGASVTWRACNKSIVDVEPISCRKQHVTRWEARPGLCASVCRCSLWRIFCTILVFVNECNDVRVLHIKQEAARVLTVCVLILLAGGRSSYVSLRLDNSHSHTHAVAKWVLKCSLLSPSVLTLPAHGAAETEYCKNGNSDNKTTKKIKSGRWN